MFALPTFAVVPAMNGFGAVVLPVVDGSIYGWVLIAAMLVTAFAVLSSNRTHRSDRVIVPPAPRQRERLISIDIPREVAA